MPVVLTSQEKKVLGFLVLMVVLGLVMLGLKSLNIDHREDAKAVKEIQNSR